jgi:hypothetical protein
VLKNFLYLNEDSLAAYLSSLEGGLRGSSEKSSSTSKVLTGGVDAKVVKGTAEGSREEAVHISLADTAQARFERLEGLATENAEQSGWVTVNSPDDDLDGIGIGALVDIECEIYVPDQIRLLSSTGGTREALNTLEALRPMAEMVGLDTGSVPTPEESGAFRSMVSNLGSDQVLVGERDDSNWRIAGKLLGRHLNGEIEGFARVVGKVSAAWRAGQWKPILSLPGMNIMPREQRRRLEREGPEPGNSESWLEGPALMLDLLAVYR